MALNDTILKTLMLIPMVPFIGADAEKIWGAYAKGVIAGLRQGKAVAILDDKSIGAVLPGGYVVNGLIVSQQIQKALIDIGQTLTPKQIEIAGAIGASTQQIMAIATTPVLTSQGFGAIHGGPVVMLPIVIANFIGIVPGPEGAPTPLQLQFFQAISQIATHTLTALQVSTGPGPGAVNGTIS